MSKSHINDNYFGIDVAKDELVIRKHNDSWSMITTNDEIGIKKLIRNLKLQKPELIVIEPTGGYERRFVQLGLKAGLAISVVNPRQVRQFAQATGQLAETDSLDAKILAQFAAVIRPKTTSCLNESQLKLKLLIVRRRQLKKHLGCEKTRLKQSPLFIQSSIKLMIKILNKQIALLDKNISSLISRNKQLTKQIELLVSMPGVGSQTAQELLINLSELGHLNRRKIVSLAGLAPYCFDSGKFKGKRIIWGGRSQVRSILYMSALTSIRCNKRLKEFYNRLVNRGKAKKVALVAVMRKILITLNVMLQTNTAWRSIN